MFRTVDFQPTRTSPIPVTALCTLTFLLCLFVTKTVWAGCGSGWTDAVVPDNPLGYEFNHACEIHDNCYDTCGQTKAVCDLNFRDDMGKECELKNKLAAQRARRAQAYIDKAASYPRYRIFIRSYYVLLAGKETAKAARAKLQYAACSALAETYYLAVHNLGTGPYCNAQKAKTCCPVPRECVSYYRCNPPPPPPEKKISVHSPIPEAPPRQEQQVRVDNSQWCEYFVWERPTPSTPTEEVPETPQGPVKEEDPVTQGPVVVEETPQGPRRITTFNPDPTVIGPITPFNPEEHKQPKEEEKESGPPPTVYVKVKTSVIEQGKTKTKPVAGAQFKLSQLAPPLPVAGNRKTDEGHDQGPSQTVTNDTGEAVITPSSLPQRPGPAENGHEKESWYVKMFEELNPAVEAVAAPKKGGRERHIEIVLPSIDSYILKIKIDRSKKEWDKPVTYIGKEAAQYVVRSWVGGKTLYAVINLPETAGAKQ